MWRSFYVLLILATINVFAHNTSLRVALIIPTTTNRSHVSNIYQIGPAVEMAFEHAGKNYSALLDISVRYIVDDAVRTCDDLASNIADMLAKYYYSKQRQIDLTVLGPFTGYVV